MYTIYIYVSLFCFVCLQDQITYEIPGNPKEQKAIKYFFVTPDTGVLHLKQSLQNDTSRTTQYTVSESTTSSQ